MKNFLTDVMAGISGFIGSISPGRAIPKWEAQLREGDSRDAQIARAHLLEAYKRVDRLTDARRVYDDALKNLQYVSYDGVEWLEAYVLAQLAGYEYAVLKDCDLAHERARAAYEIANASGDKRTSGPVIALLKMDFPDLDF